jgi:methanethiol S-methyltransferase
MNSPSDTVHLDTGANAINRVAIFVYGVGSYVVFLATFLYAIGFIGNFAVPKSLDSQGSASWQHALVVDLGLLSLFAVQHSVMARPAFKRVITRILPPSAERSTYVLASSLALALLFWKWQPLGGTIWNVESPVGRGLLYAGFSFGWALVLIATFVINHFDLFGLRQVWRQLRSLPQANAQFVVPLLYRIVRHPLYVGWFFAFWSTPTMTISHLFFALVTTAYILVAIRFEEADLIKEHSQYAVYRKQVPMLIPRLTRTVSFLQNDNRRISAESLRNTNAGRERSRA